jgi:hypothetical protein
MCSRCGTDLRALPVTAVAALLDDRSICVALRTHAERELAERLAAQDLDDPQDEQV